jgi:tyrosyl-tRNA synthetase
MPHPPKVRMKTVIEHLQERGFIEAMSSEELHAMAQKPLRVFCGFDPTADSLHLGHMVALMGLAWFQRYGHTPFALMGGATAMIGDPSGKKSERQLLDQETIERNLIGIKKNLERVLAASNAQTTPTLVNNLDWFKEFSFIGFLRDVGKYCRIGPMLAKESVKLRQTSEEGMSFTEFSYQLLQGYDFLYLYDQHGVTLQLGGSDQWGNITAGTELIRKMRGATAYGITFPLLTRSDGQKFGKSEQGAIWLSPEKCSPYEFYQYLVRVSDADVIKLMRLLTFMEMPEILSYAEGMQKPDYVPNSNQKRLAEEVTRLVHGEQGLEMALRVTMAAAPGAETALNAEALEKVSCEMPSYSLPKNQILGHKLVDTLVKLGIQPSKSEARRLVRNGGLYLNNQKIEDENVQILEESFVEGKFLLIAAGKKNKFLIRSETETKQL